MSLCQLLKGDQLSLNYTQQLSSVLLFFTWFSGQGGIDLVGIESKVGGLGCLFQSSYFNYSKNRHQQETGWTA